MSLQERLRDLAESAAVAAPSVVRRHASAAADRIDVLERAVLYYAQCPHGGCDHCLQIAREALRSL